MTENNQPIRIVHLEDMSKDIEQVNAVLKNSEFDFDIKVVDSITEFRRALTEFQPDLIISHSLPSCNSIKAIDVARRLGIKIPFIVVARPVTEYHALEALTHGAYDYVMNDRYNRLPTIVINALQKFQLENELKEKVVSLIKSEKKYADLIEHLPANIVLLDKTGTIVRVNNAWRLFADENGFRGKTYGIGTNYLEITQQACHGDLKISQEVVRSLKEMMEGKLFHFSMAYPCHSTEKKRWFRVIATRENASNDSGIVMMHFDITEQMLAEEKRAEITHELQSRNKDLEKFAFMVSHDLRAPVANIIGIADALNSDMNENDEDKLMKMHLATSIHKLDNVIKDLNEILQVKKDKPTEFRIEFENKIKETIKCSCN